MLINRKIIWEKWEDPFIFPELKEQETTDSDYSEYESEYEDQEEEIEAIENDAIILYSSMGVIPYNEKTPSSKIFNFWIGHTNFDITNSVQELISAVTGVEILDVFTRYRFRIAVAKAFKDRNVMNDISTAISDIG
jgi:hypothetical protein